MKPGLPISACTLGVKEEGKNITDYVAQLLGVGEDMCWTPKERPGEDQPIVKRHYFQK